MAQQITHTTLSDFEQLFRTHYSILFAQGYHFYPNREWVKDELQSFFLYLWEKQIDWGTIDHPNAYMRKAFARQLLRNKQRLQRDATRLQQAVLTQQQTLDEASIAQQSEQLEAVQAALSGLPEQQKAMLQQRFQEGLSYEEIAAHTGKSKQTVYNQIYTGLKKLRQALGGMSTVLLSFLLH